MSLKRFNKSENLSAKHEQDVMPAISSFGRVENQYKPLKREHSSNIGHASEGGSSFPNGRSRDLDSDDSSFPAPKKRKTKAKAVKPNLSFEQDDDSDEAAISMPARRAPMSAPEPRDGDGKELQRDGRKARLGPNVAAGYVPKAITKHSLRQEAERKECLREDFRRQQEAVKAAEIIVPFVFFEGTNTLTGRIKMRKGDTADVLLSRAQKTLVKEDYKKWVHLKLDDLMLVRGGVMIPHYLTVHYFILTGVRGPQGLLFDFSAQAPAEIQQKPDEELEGFDHDPNLTKIVDVKWYKDHKHIYPCNIWEWFDPHNPDKDYGYAKTARRDAHGNSFFA